jgi:hypothetical protein
MNLKYEKFMDYMYLDDVTHHVKSFAVYLTDNKSLILVDLST